MSIAPKVRSFHSGAITLTIVIRVITDNARNNSIAKLHIVYVQYTYNTLSAKMQNVYKKFTCIHRTDGVIVEYVDCAKVRSVHSGAVTLTIVRRLLRENARSECCAKLQIIYMQATVMRYSKKFCKFYIRVS